MSAHKWLDSSLDSWFLKANFQFKESLHLWKKPPGRAKSDQKEVKSWLVATYYRHSDVCLFSYSAFPLKGLSDLSILVGFRGGAGTSMMALFVVTLIRGEIYSCTDFTNISPSREEVLWINCLKMLGSYHDTKPWQLDGYHDSRVAWSIGISSFSKLIIAGVWAQLVCPCFDQFLKPCEVNWTKATYTGWSLHISLDNCTILLSASQSIRRYLGC